MTYVIGFMCLKEQHQGLLWQQSEVIQRLLACKDGASFDSCLVVSYLFKVNFNLNKLDCCDVCHRSKQCRLPFSQSYNKAKEPFGLIHCDLWGRYHTASHNGSHYFLTIVDDFTRGTWVYLLRDKTETRGALVNFHNMVQTQFNTKIKKLRSDNGTEFINAAFQKYLQQEGIIHETSCVGTPQ